jgi:uncharacterized protein YbcC (UPF0753/DUF2309 family)
MNNHAYNEEPEVVDFPVVISEVSQRIAPVWPLDTAIAVNPWWSLRSKKFSDVSSNLEALGDVKCLMPKAFYQQHWWKTIKPEHLEAAAKAQQYEGDVNLLVGELKKTDQPLSHWHNLSDLLDGLPEHSRKITWRDEIVQQISQFCGLYFQYPEQIKDMSQNTDQLYKTWLDVARKDKGIEVVMAEKGLHQHFLDLPDCPKKLCENFIQMLGSPENFDDYAHALLLDVHGWASLLAYHVWQDNFTETANTLVEQLLAIRLAWESVLWTQNKQLHEDTFASLSAHFLKQFDNLPSLKLEYQQQQKALWVWQHALEISYQSQLHEKLHIEITKASESDSTIKNTPVLQAAFCIDVRSEPMRRALEAQHSDIETLGFAGFFGLPLEYAFNDSQYRRPQLPGLLAPAIQAIQKGREDKTESISNKLHFSQHQKNAFDASPASLGLVEMFGIFKIGELLKQNFWPTKPEHSINDLCDNSLFELSRDGVSLSLAEQSELAAGILKNLGLTKCFAPTVLLLGHSSCTANNPQAAGLDCGACGGQTGEVNVKILAQLLNDDLVRSELKKAGIDIPITTQFVAGLHNTTIDNIVLYGHKIDKNCEYWLAEATLQAQIKRAKTLGILAKQDTSLAYTKRSQDWSELRPEWGLVNNAAFIIAPRRLTRDLDLEGRSFLHDYVWQKDHDFSILELIMTAPMIVTNWINLQYYASVTDNRLYGSGNKLLHNVVGDHLGVFEGNGGDLRIGLSMQSLHDGNDWRHTPVRLSVYISAPQSAIASIVEKHEALAQLINNEWLYVFQVDEEINEISRYFHSEWHVQSKLKTQSQMKETSLETV